MDTPEWLEPVGDYEGVGAPPVGDTNLRYDPVDEPAAVVALRDAIPPETTRRTPRAFQRRNAVDVGGYVRRLDGIDISHYQPEAGKMSIQAVRDIPTDWIAFKATQSVRYVDPYLVQFRHGGNLFRHASFYHWLSSTTDPQQQAAHFVRTMGVMRRGEGAMLDAEESGITVDGCLAWLNAVESAIKRPCSVYTGLYVTGGTIWRDPRVRTSRFGPRPMHLAAYISVASLRTRLTSLGVAHLPIDAWQWSSDGPVPGVTGRCDMNSVINRSAYDIACALDATPPPPLEDDMKYSILARSADPGDPHRWVTNGLVRVLPTVESIGWLVAKGLVEPGQDILHPDPVSDEVLAGIPLVAALDAPTVTCRFDPGVCRAGAMAGTVQLAPQ